MKTVRSQKALAEGFVVDGQKPVAYFDSVSVIT